MFLPQKSHEQNPLKETEVGFEDADLTFDKDFNYFGVVMVDIKRTQEQRVFQACLSNKEKKWQKKRMLSTRPSY